MDWNEKFNSIMKGNVPKVFNKIIEHHSNSALTNATSI